jgi:hypothetical protein
VPEEVTETHVESAGLHLLEGGAAVAVEHLESQVGPPRPEFLDGPRFFACEQDRSHDPPDAPLPEAVPRGTEPLVIRGAIAGG